MRYVCLLGVGEVMVCPKCVVVVSGRRGCLNNKVGWGGVLVDS